MSDVIIEPRSQQNESHRHLSKKSEFKSASTIYKSTQENYDVLRTIYPSTSRFASEREYYYYIRSYGRATSAASFDKKTFITVPISLQNFAFQETSVATTNTD